MPLTSLRVNKSELKRFDHNFINFANSEENKESAVLEEKIDQIRSDQ